MQPNYSEKFEANDAQVFGGVGGYHDFEARRFWDYFGELRVYQ